ncbi:hypothetical protein N665_0573s0023 [Sinapis alba]|nr:hypothetical protein N665_0573s0023 [Sinapis alba]
MVIAANFFKLDSPESDIDEERTTTSKVAAQSQGTVTEGNSVKKKKKASVEPDSDDGGKKSKKKKKVSGGDEIGNTETSKVSEENRSHEKSLTNTDDDDDDGKRKRKRVDDTDRGDTSLKPKNKKMKKTIAEDPKKKRKKKQTEDPEVDKDSTEDAEKTQSENSEADLKKSTKVAKKKRKKKQNEAPEVDKDSTEDAEKKEGSDLNSPEIAKKKSKKKKKQTEDPEAEENNNNEKEKRKKKKKQTEEPEAEENNNNEKEKRKKKKKQTEEPEAEENNNNEKEKRKKKKKQTEDPEAEENNNNEKEKRKKKKKKGGKSDEVVTTPSRKSAKKVNFSDQVEVFPAESEESDEEEKVDLVRGKRFTEQEDELIKKSVLEYVDNHALGDEGINMVMNCKAHKQLKGCWKEIAAALPWRPYLGVYYRAHTLFEEGSKGVWTKEDLELVVQHQKKRGNDWRTLADAMGKHRNHVKDAWRRIRLASKKRGHWSMEEYQSLFDLVNKDLRIKMFKEKHSKHGMLKDNIPWMAISDQLGTRDHAVCCLKWYDQLTSPMVKNGEWANVDDYRLLDELTNLDAACVDDVDWDNLLDNRDGDTCRSRWNQMVNHIGLPGSKTFAEQVDVLSQRYCPDIAEDREDFDNRPFDPED